MLSEDLLSKAVMIRDTEYFVNHSEGCELSEKQSIFLVLAGMKPVSEATSGKWIGTEHGAHSVPEDEQQIGAFLTSLGLAYSLRSDEIATDAILSLDQSLIDEYMNTHEAAAAGRLFGYPESATRVFNTAGAMEPDEQDRLMQATGMLECMPCFRMSKAHANEEIEVLKSWHGILNQYGLV